MKTVTFTLSNTSGLNLGPFDLYSNIDSYISPFETGVSREDLIAGYTSTVVPDFSTTVRVFSVGACTNSTEVTLPAVCTPFEVQIEEVLDEIYYFTFTGADNCPPYVTITFTTPITVYLRESEITGTIGAQIFPFYSDASATIPVSGTELETITNGLLLIQDHDFPYAFACVGTDGFNGGTGSCPACK